MIKKQVKLLCAGLMLSYSTVAFTQESYRDCAAAFLDNKMVVDEYTSKGKCTVAASASGVLTVNTAELSPEGSLPKSPVFFKIAIRDKETGTLVMFSEKALKQVEIRQVLARCSKGDRIVLLTTDSQYALPHNEILVL